MTSMVANLAIILGSMQLSKRIDWENPATLFNVRCAYLGSNLVIFGIFLYIYMQIQKRNDQTVLKYVDAAQPFSQDAPPLITTTVQEYDTTQLKSAVKSALMGIGMMGVMHLYMGYTQPLLVQSIMPLKTALESKVAQVHVLGKEPVGELKRPWKTGGLFAGAGGDNGPKTDKKAIKEAEKRAGEAKME